MHNNESSLAMQEPFLKSHTMNAELLQSGRERLPHLLISVSQQCMSVHFLLRDRVPYPAADLGTQRKKFIYHIPVRENKK